ncbi:hypothetical protein Tco_0835543, partial [Tanacetum coccineum]
LGGLEFSEFVHDPQHVCSRSSSLAITSSGLSSDVSDVGLPSEKVMTSGKNGDDGDLLLFRDGPGACDISAGTLRLASQVFLEGNVSWRLPVPGGCQIRCIARFEWLGILCLEDMSRSVGFKHWSGNDTDADDADIRPIYDEEPMVEVQLTAECNIFAIGQQHTEQPKIINEAQIQEKVFAIAALKNELRKLKGNSVDTKFDKTSVLGKPVLPSLRNQSVVRQPNAFKSERAQMSKQRNSSKNMPRFSSNDMVHNHYLDEARKKTQERDRNSKTSVMPSARFQSTADGSKPKL